MRDAPTEIQESGAPLRGIGVFWPGRSKFFGESVKRTNSTTALFHSFFCLRAKIDCVPAASTAGKKCPKMTIFAPIPGCTQRTES